MMRALSIIVLAGLFPLSMAAAGVKGTFFTERTTGGACELPSTATYVITGSLALGQGTALGDLKYTGAMCGKVLEVNCGGSTVEAVVSNACNENTDTCGVDLIGAAWDTATGNKEKGIVECSVSLSSKNPMAGGPTCFVRPNSDFGHENNVILNVFNIGTGMVTGATLSGVQGRKDGGGWYAFNGDKIALPSSDVVFTLTTGTAAFKLSDCVFGGNVTATF